MRTEIFQTPDGVRLRIGLASGRVEIETADTAETVVELSGPREEDAKIEQHGKDVIVEVEHRRLPFGSSHDHRLVVRAPAGACVDANVASADLAARGRYDSVKVNSASGDVSVEDTAEVSVRTASGDVELGRVSGSGTVRSASGDVSVSELEGDLRIQTASGDQRVVSAAQGKVTLQAASGDLEIGIRRGSKVWVEASSMSGRTSSELELGDAPPDGDGPLVELEAKTMSGDIEVRRAP
jgi:DUF4097 and DUF4098 domain-containing protein YvlB